MRILKIILIAFFLILSLLCSIAATLILSWSLSGIDSYTIGLICISSFISWLTVIIIMSFIKGRGPGENILIMDRQARLMSCLFVITLHDTSLADNYIIKAMNDNIITKKERG